LVAVEWVFCWGFCEIGCANVVLLRGKRGGVVDICVAKRGGTFRAGNGTGFWDLFLPGQGDGENLAGTRAVVACDEQRTTTATTNAGILRCAQDDSFLKGGNRRMVSMVLGRWRLLKGVS
jgi:hypothetical protein